jgi:hypothetical protein
MRRYSVPIEDQVSEFTIVFSVPGNQGIPYIIEADDIGHAANVFAHFLHEDFDAGEGPSVWRKIMISEKGSPEYPLYFKHNEVRAFSVHPGRTSF